MSDLTHGSRATTGQAPASMRLDTQALRAAAEHLDDGAVTPSFGPHRDRIVALLNDALATELVCILRYKRHHYTASGIASPAVAEEFMVHAQEETAHADLLAERIAQLGGEPDFNPSTLLSRSHAEYNEATDLQQMIRANLIAERVAIESYRQMIDIVRDIDPTTRGILEQILKDEEEHADELADWLER